MPPSTTLPLDVHQNYGQYLKKTMARAMGARHTHTSRSERLSEIKFGYLKF